MPQSNFIELLGEKNKHVLIWLARAVHFVQTIEFVMAPYGVGVPSMC